jgi:hypothetical protein
MVHFRFLAYGFVVVALSGCGTASIPDEMRGIFEGQQAGVNRFLPVITLNGSQEITLEVFSTYQELGASAQSLRDGVINPSTIQISSNLNTSALGQYSIVYSVSDSGGRFSSITRTVNVVDTTVPLISINQNPTVTFEKLGYGNSNTLPYNDGVPGFNGVVATDNYDAAINSKISAVSTVNSSSEGDYFVTYNVADQSNNPAIPKSRIVQVRDTKAPGISIGAPSSSLLSAGDVVTLDLSFEDASVIGLDGKLQIVPIDGAVISCQINSSESGLESRQITVSNCSGNGSFKVRVLQGAALDNATLPAPNQTAMVESAEIVVDNDGPTVTIGEPSVALANSSTQINFPLTVAGARGGESIDWNEVNLLGGINCSSKNVLNGNSPTPTVRLSGCSGNGELRIRVSQGAVRDAANNQSPEVDSSPVTIDNTAPTISISAPSIAGGFQALRNASGSSASYTVTYTGADTITLSISNISLNATGGASCSVAVSGTGNTSRVVTLSSCTGNGTVGISIQASTAVDLAGNTAPAAGSSVAVTIDNTAPVFSFGAAGSNIDLCSSSTPYLTQGVSVNETLSGAFSVQSNNVDRLVAGNYQVVFVGTDLAGNQGSGTRSVNVNPLSLGSGDQSFSFEYGVATAQNFLDRMITNEFNGNAQNSLNIALCNDINFNDQSITTRARLNGKFDGQGFTIRNAQINPSSNGSSLSQASLGLFQAVLNGGLIRNLKLDNIRVGDPNDLRDHTGAVAGRNLGRIERLQVLNSRVEGRSQSGGLVGWNLSEGLVSESASSAIVVAEEIAGGLIGLNNGSLASSYRAIDQSQEPSIQISRATGGVVGGLVGRSDGSIIQSYSNAHDICDGTHDLEGGLVGDGSNAATDSYFNSQLSRCTGVGELSDEQMKMPGSFAGFDTVAFWNLIAGEYPELKWIAGQ